MQDEAEKNMTAQVVRCTEGLDYKHAIANLPAAELDAIRAQIGRAGFATQTKEKWMSDIVFSRIRNAVCNFCFLATFVTLKFCAKCHCTWYCSDKCRQQDATMHRLWCCQSVTSPDMGPLRTFVKPVYQMSIPFTTTSSGASLVHARASSVHAGSSASKQLSTETRTCVRYEICRLGPRDALSVHHLYQYRAKQIQYHAQINAQVEHALPKKHKKFFTFHEWCFLLTQMYERVHNSAIVTTSGRITACMREICAQILPRLMEYVCAHTDTTYAEQSDDTRKSILHNILEGVFIAADDNGVDVRCGADATSSVLEERRTPDNCIVHFVGSPEEKKEKHTSSAHTSLNTAEQVKNEEIQNNDFCVSELHNCQDKLKLKQKGNALFNKGQFCDALLYYTQGMRLIEGSPWSLLDIVLVMNRSKTFARLNMWMHAFMDISLIETYAEQPVYAGVIYRVQDVKSKIECLCELKMYTEARQAFEQDLLYHPRLTLEERSELLKDYTRVRLLAFLQTDEHGHARSHLQTTERSADDNTPIGSYRICMQPLFEKLSTPMLPSAQNDPFVHINKNTMGRVTIRNAGAVAGAGIFAERSFSKGDVIYRERAALAISLEHNRCQVCMKKNVTVACERNCGELYCSVTCREAAKKMFHFKRYCSAVVQQETKMTRERMNQKGAKVADRVLLLLQKLLASWTYHDSILNHPLVRLLRLPVWQDQPPLEYVSEMCGQWHAMLALTRADPLYFDFPTFEYVRFLCLQYAIDLCSDSATNKERGFGVALYATSSFLNHGCTPNAVWKINADTAGDTLKLVALRPISANEEVLVSYTNVNMDCDTRQKDLQLRYGFTCQCTKCQQQK
jgi:tetratricopeptide (TPR) repeat protein